MLGNLHRTNPLLIICFCQDTMPDLQLWHVPHLPVQLISTPRDLLNKGQKGKECVISKSFQIIIIKNCGSNIFYLTKELHMKCLVRNTTY